MPIAVKGITQTQAVKHKKVYSLKNKAEHKAKLNYNYTF